MFVRLFFFLFLAAINVHLYAQDNDFGWWMNAELDYSYNKDLSFSIAPELRFNENATQLRTYFTDFGVQYDVQKNFFIAGTLRWGAVLRRGNYLSRRRIQLGAGHKWKGDNWTATFLSRVQLGFTGIRSEGEVDLNSNWRNRFSFKYTGLKKLDLLTSYEFFHGIDAMEFLQWQNWRWQLKGEYKVKKQHFVTLGLLMQRDMDGRTPENHFVLLTGYRYELKRAKKTDEKKS